MYAIKSMEFEEQGASNWCRQAGDFFPVDPDPTARKTEFKYGLKFVPF